MTKAMASEPTMDEILASIRKIISEEPGGTRTQAPKPAPSAFPAAPLWPALPGGNGVPSSDATAASAKEAKPSGPSAATPPASAPSTTSAVVDPIAAALSRSAQSRVPGKETPPPAVPSTSDTSSAAAPGSPSTDTSNEFNRLAAALRGPGSPQSMFAEPPPPALELPLPPAPSADSSPPSPSDDLDDLFEDMAPAAKQTSSPSATPAVIETKSSASEPERAPSGRVISRRSLDFGAIVPGRMEALPVADEKPAASSAPSEEEAPEKLSLQASEPFVKPTSQARAFDKMLSARIAQAAKPARQVAEPPAGPIVIAAMPERGASELAKSETGPQSIGPESQDATGEALPDLDTSDEAQSALGMLAAGLAASSSSPTSSDARMVENSDPEFSEISADDEPTLVVEPPAMFAEPQASEEQGPPPVRLEAADRAPQSLQPERTSPEPVAPPQAIAPPPPVVRDASAILRGAMSVPSRKASAAEPVAEAGTPPADAPTPAPSKTQTHGTAVTTPAAIASQLAIPAAGSAVGVRTVEDIVAELLRPMLREWLAENMPRIVEKALRIELAEGLKTVQHVPAKKP